MISTPPTILWRTYRISLLERKRGYRPHIFGPAEWILELQINKMNESNDGNDSSKQIKSMEENKNVLINWFHAWCVIIAWLYREPARARGAIWSTSASSNTMKGDLPPSSSVTAFKLLVAAACITRCPVSVDPVKLTWWWSRYHKITWEHTYILFYFWQIIIF